jgi:phenylalanyl-tRNA synthetase beta subunit
MAQEEAQTQNIEVGAVVEASDGLIGTVAGLVTDPGTGQLQKLVVQNEAQNKQFTFSTDLIKQVIGHKVVHMKISRDEIADYADNMEIDTRTGNIASPTLPPPQ